VTTGPDARGAGGAVAVVRASGRAGAVGPAEDGPKVPAPVGPAALPGTRGGVTP
jgi:hypothetical protein